MLAEIFFKNVWCIAVPFHATIKFIKMYILSTETLLFIVYFMHKIIYGSFKSWNQLSYTQHVYMPNISDDNADFKVRYWKFKMSLTHQLSDLHICSIYWNILHLRMSVITWLIPTFEKEPCVKTLNWKRYITMV
jgi:hypothetical protein